MATFKRKPVNAILVVFQVAISLAVLANAAWILEQRAAALGRPTGLADADIFVISSAAFTERFNYATSRRDDLAYLRGLAGVVAAAPSDAAPFSQTGFATDVWNNPNQSGMPIELNAFSMDEQGLAALGGHVLEGRDFRADEIAPPPSQRSTDFAAEMLITRAAADALFPGQSALGKTVYDSTGQPAAVVGIIGNTLGSVPHGLRQGYQVAIFPRLPEARSLIYVVRVDPGRRDELLRAAELHLARSNPDRVIKFARPLDIYKRRLFLADTNMETYLAVAVSLVLLTTCLGIYGLVTFNVSTRTRHIGTRRALGARRRDILQYFLVENGLLTAAGVSLGMFLAFAAGAWLTREFGEPKLNPLYVVGSMPALWLIGQLSAWIPARRAMSVQPSVAARTL